MAIVPQGADQEFLHQLAKALGYGFADIVIGTPRNAIASFASRTSMPRYILLDIGDKAHDVLPEIDDLAEHCEEGTRVIVIGKVNDVSFYRDLRARGVLEYFTPPAQVADLQKAFLAGGTNEVDKGSKVITFMSAASGDGASTLALNTAYALATECNKSVVLVDMDYQFGMIAKNLDLAANFGIKELFEHPDRGIDSTLVKRMLVPYSSSKLSIISAPNELRPIPELRPEVIRDLVLTLKNEYDVVVLDLPHIWNPWISSTLALASHVTLVAQLWLRSVTHSSRLLNAWRSSGRDFERVCALQIKSYFTNDIRATVSAENQGKTILEGGSSSLSKQINEFANYLNTQ
jgi:pilus assembly protein CpaE